MKKLLLALVVTWSASTTVAASAVVMKAVLDSDAVSRVVMIEKLEVIQTYRCRNCYDIKVTGSNMQGPAYVVVRTEQHGAGRIDTYLVESSR